MNCRDGSITTGKFNGASNEEYIKYGILKPRIEWGASSLCTFPPRQDSDWVNWEIECAHREGKRIVGVWEWGAKDCELPDARYGDAVVGWHGENIINAITANRTTRIRRTGKKQAIVQSPGILADDANDPKTALYCGSQRLCRFAPNPFYGLLHSGDLQARHAQERCHSTGLSEGSKSGSRRRLVYAMRVSEILSFEQYWDDPRFWQKRPNLHGSLKQAFGDNIYYRDPKTGQWRQKDSHHSLINGRHSRPTSTAIRRPIGFLSVTTSFIGVVTDLRFLSSVGKAYARREWGIKPISLMKLCRNLSTGYATSGTSGTAVHP